MCSTHPKSSCTVSIPTRPPPWSFRAPRSNQGCCSHQRSTGSLLPATHTRRDGETSPEHEEAPWLWSLEAPTAGGPKATSGRQSCWALAGVGARAPSEMAQASRAAFLSHPSPSSVPPCQVSPQKARKETVRAFWSRPPEACLCWGGQREGGRGRRKAEKKGEARQRAPSTFEAVSNPSRWWWGGGPEL